MVTIDGKFILAYLFAYGMHEIRLCQLRELVNLIYEKVPQDLFVDITTVNISSIIQRNNDLFAEISDVAGYRIIRGWRQDPQKYFQNKISDAIIAGELSLEEMKQVQVAFTLILQDENVRAILDEITFEDPFTKVYVENIFNWRIKEPYRTRFKEIIAAYAKSQLSPEEKVTKSLT